VRLRKVAGETVSSSRRAKGRSAPGGDPEAGEDDRSHEQDCTITHGKVGDGRSCHGKKHAGVGPLLQPRKARDKPPPAPSDCEDDGEVGRIAQMRHDAGEGR
jgi:hypothetical protein